jgi:hypothetical protein
MGTLAETAIVNFHLSFANQGKQTYKETEVCRFHFPFVANKQKLPFSVGSFFSVCVFVCGGCLGVCGGVFVFVYVDIFIFIWFIVHIYIYIYMMPLKTENGSPGDFP